MLENFTANIIKKIIRQLNGGVFSGRQNFSDHRRPQGFVVSTTTRCNFNCPHCLRSGIDKGKTLIKDLPISVFEEVLMEGKKIDFKFVTFTGGEPILRPQFGELVSLVGKYDYEFNFATNGWLSKEYWEVIKEYKKNLGRIFLSLDGTTSKVHDAVRNKTGSFEKAIEAVKFYRNHNLAITASFCVTKKNLEEIENFPEFCLGLGINTIKYSAALPVYDNSGILNAEYVLTDKERIDAIKKISILEERFKECEFLITRSFYPASAALSSEATFKKRKINLWSWCPMLDMIYIDHDGAMLFCCDINRDYKNKPLVQKLGFEKSLGITLNSVNEMRKRFLAASLNNQKINRFCDFCNENFKDCLDLAKRQGP